MILHRSLFWFFFLGLFVVLPLDAGAQLVKKSVAYEGGTRDWFEHVPVSYNGSKAVPLVIALHGAYGSGDGYANDAGWLDVSDANGFIVIFPNGEGHDNLLFWNTWVFNGSKPDDIGFLLKVIAQVEATYKIDTTRIYMTGFSNGGGMTSFFAAAHTDLLAAIAPLSGGWLTALKLPESKLSPDAPMATWIWRGEKDDTDPDAVPLLTQDKQQTAFWVHINADDTTPRRTTLDTATTSIYSGGQAEVRYTLVSSLAHAIQPGSAARIWTEFFSRFTRVNSGVHDATLPVIKVTADAPKASAVDKLKGSFLVSRDGGATGNVSVNYQVGGTAVGGIDYKRLSGTATLPAGTTSAHVKVRPKVVSNATGKKTVRLSLLPSDAYLLGEQTAAKVKIIEGP